MNFKYIFTSNTFDPAKFAEFMMLTSDVAYRMDEEVAYVIKEMRNGDTVVEIEIGDGTYAYAGTLERNLVDLGGQKVDVMILKFRSDHPLYMVSSNLTAVFSGLLGAYQGKFNVKINSVMGWTEFVFTFNNAISDFDKQILIKQMREMGCYLLV